MKHVFKFEKWSTLLIVVGLAGLLVLRRSQVFNKTGAKQTETDEKDLDLDLFEVNKPKKAKIPANVNDPIKKMINDDSELFYLMGRLGYDYKIL